MKLKHLLLTALMLVVGIGSSWADDIQDLRATGWTQVTELTDVVNNYYVFVDAASGNYSIGRGLNAGDRPMSHVLGNPAVDNSQVWILEGSGSTFKMKSLKDGYYFNSGNAGWNDSMNATDGTDFTFTLNEGKYDISASTGNVGPWNNNNKVELANAAENIAVNKAANQAPGYYVFAMSRTAYDAAKFSAAQLEAQGWTKATDIAAAAGDNFVIFLEAKGGSQVVSRNESGRPAYKSLGNPLYNKHELWTIEGDIDNYALKSEASAQYLNDQGWNTGFGDLGDASRRKFVSLEDGKYAIQNKSNNDWIGRWQDQESAPFELENIAANKNEAQRGNYYVYYMSKSDYATKRATALAAATEGASASSPADLTDFIYNPRFSDLDRWGWTEGGSSGNRQFSANVAECWNNNNMTFTQTLTGMPNGKYTISVQAVNPDNGSSTGAKLVGNTVEKAIETSHSSNDYATVAADLMKNETLGQAELDVMVTDGNLELGIKAATGWVIFDNFKLTYKGEDLSDYEAAYTAACTAAKAVDVEKPMNKDVKSALETAISTYADKTYTTVASITEAISALETATTNANKSINHYAAAKAALDAQKALMDGTNIYNAEGFAAYLTAWTTNSEKYENNTLTNEDAVVNPTAKTDLHASTAYNFLLTPWTIGGEACNNFDKALYINTWSEEGNTDGTNFYTPFFEYWVKDGESLGNNTLATMVTDLENGLYSATAWVRVRAKNGVTATEATGINLVVGDGAYAGTEGNGTVDATEGAQVGTSQFTLAEVTAYALVKDGNFNIKFEVKDANISWLSFKNVKYAKVRDLTEEEKMVPATPEQIAAFNAAIEAAEAKTVGFQKGQYSPYANAEAIKALADAKEINTENPVDVEVINAAMAAIADENWTVNTEEVNAVFNGDFEGAYAAVPNSGVSSDRDIFLPEGWSFRKNGINTNDIVVLKTSDKAGNNVTSIASLENGGENTLMYRGKWGNTTNLDFYQKITLPAGTYVLSCDAWKSGLGGDSKIYVGAANEASLEGNEASWRPLSLTFTLDEEKTVEVGINIKHTSDNSEKFIGFDNFELYSVKEVSADMTISSVGTATFCAPFDVEIPEGVTAYEAKIADNSWVKLEDAKLVEGKLPAGTPVVLKGEAMQKTFTDVPTVTVTKSSCLVGNLGTEKVEVVANAGNYLLQKNDGVLAWYQVKDAGLYIGVNRCYLEFSGDNAREFFPMDFDNPTGIDSIATEAKTKADGKYLVNGKIVVVKAGKVYELK